MLQEWIATWWASVWQLLVESAPWLLAGFAFAGVVYVLLPVEKLTKHLGRPGLGSVIKAALIGVPLPLCSCSVIPVASSIRRQGASKGAFLSFIISTPETGADSIAISYALLGPLLAVVRPIAAAITAIAAGLLADATAADDAPSGNADDSACCNDAPLQPTAAADSCGDGCGAQSAEKPAGGRWMTALRYGFIEMFADLAPWLVAGFALAGLASALVPDGFIEQHVGAGLGAMLLMLVIGMPMYVCATSSTPIAAALIAKGLSPGAALVFLLVGPATNIATMVIVARNAGKRGVLIYLATIAIVAVGIGLLLDAFNGITVSAGAAATLDPEACAPGMTATASAVILILLIANGLRINLTHRLRKRRAAF